MRAQEYIIRDPDMQARVCGMIAALDLSMPMVVSVKQHRKKRSLSQNALMWKWINEAADILGSQLGYDQDDMHEIFKKKFLPASGRKLIEIGGEAHERLTTTNLTPQEMSEYMNSIDRFCASFGCLLPHPEDMHAR